MLDAVQGGSLGGQSALRQLDKPPMLKSAYEDAAQILDNYEDALRYFAPFFCFYDMLTARGFVPFAPRKCAETMRVEDRTPTTEADYISLLADEIAKSAAEGANRTRFALKPEECLYSGLTSAT